MKIIYTILFFLMTLSSLSLNAEEDFDKDGVHELQAALEQAKQQLRKTSQQIAELSQKLGRQSAATRVHRYFGNPERAVIGVILRAREKSTEGVEIIGLTPGGPAEAAGLKTGDMITAVNDAPLKPTAKTDTALETAYAKLNDLKEGEQIKLSYLRDKKTLHLTLTAKRMAPENYVFDMKLLDDMDFDFDAELPHFKIKRFINDQHDVEVEEHIRNMQNDFMHQDVFVMRGQRALWHNLKLASINKELGHYFNTDTGVLILDIQSNLSTELKPGDVILKIADTKTNSPKDVMRVFKKINPGKQVSLEIVRQQIHKNIQITIPEYSNVFKHSPQVRFDMFNDNHGKSLTL